MRRFITVSVTDHVLNCLAVVKRMCEFGKGVNAHILIQPCLNSPPGELSVEAQQARVKPGMGGPSSFGTYCGRIQSSTQCGYYIYQPL
jgi:hypothetical protein